MFEGALVFGSSAMTALMCLQANEIGNFLGVIDRPDGGRKHHARPTPLMGGLAVLIPFLLLTMIYNNMLEGGSLALSAALVLTGGLTALGYLDDKFGLDAKLRLLAGIGLIGITILLDPSQQLQILDFGAVKVPFSAGMGLAFTILVVLGLINAVNMADGLNGRLQPALSASVDPCSGGAVGHCAGIQSEGEAVPGRCRRLRTRRLVLNSDDSHLQSNGCPDGRYCRGLVPHPRP